MFYGEERAKLLDGATPAGGYSLLFWGSGPVYAALVNWRRCFLLLPDFCTRRSYAGIIAACFPSRKKG
jgi:hypothetical protein